MKLLKILFFLVISSNFVIIGMNGNKKTCLSNEDVTDTIMQTHWQGHKDRILAILNTKEYKKKKIPIVNPDKKILGVFDTERQRVTTYFIDGTLLTLSYSKFKERLALDGEKDN